MRVDALEGVLLPIVRGQIRSFANDHPEVAAAVRWYKPRVDVTQTFVNSLSKRIIRDLLCAETRVRLIAALGASTGVEGAQERAVMASGRSGAGVELYDCASPAAQGMPTRRAETTGSVGEADGGPVAESDAPKDAPTVEVRP